MEKKIQIDNFSKEKIKFFNNIIKVQNSILKKDFSPYGWHWIFFNQNISEKDLGDDGHPQRGKFFPLLKGYKRMFAGSNLYFKNKFRLSKLLKKESFIDKISRKKKNNNNLYFVEVNNSYNSGGIEFLTEKQTIVFIKNDYKSKTIHKNNIIDPKWNLVFSGNINYGNISLFRYSALTYNSHRIHYDINYTKKVEGHPDLLVHGPLIASTVMNELYNLTKRKIKNFNFSLISPTYVNEKIHVKIYVSNLDDSIILIHAIKNKLKLTFKANAELY